MCPDACIPLHTPTHLLPHLLLFSLSFSLLPAFLFSPPSPFVLAKVGGQLASKMDLQSKTWDSQWTSWPQARSIPTWQRRDSQGNEAKPFPGAHRKNKMKQAQLKTQATTFKQKKTLTVRLVPHRYRWPRKAVESPTPDTRDIQNPAAHSPVQPALDVLSKGLATQPPEVPATSAMLWPCKQNPCSQIFFF